MPKIVDDVQLKSDQTAQLLNKRYVNEGILRGQNESLKGCQVLELLTCIEKGLRSLHTGNKGSVGQMAAKLPSINFENDLDPVGVEPGLTGLTGSWPGRRLF